MGPNPEPYLQGCHCQDSQNTPRPKMMAVATVILSSRRSSVVPPDRPPPPPNISESPLPRPEWSRMNTIRNSAHSTVIASTNALNMHLLDSGRGRAPASAQVVDSTARTARSCSGKWQAATWPSRKGYSSGSFSLQYGNWARGHRGWNRQPEGGSIGEGTSPCRMIRFFFAAIFGSAIGTAESKAPEYGVLGFLYRTSPVESSTTRPRYITATRSEM